MGNTSDKQVGSVPPSSGDGSAPASTVISVPPPEHVSPTPRALAVIDALRDRSDEADTGFSGQAMFEDVAFRIGRVSHSRAARFADAMGFNRMGRLRGAPGQRGAEMWFGPGSMEQRMGPYSPYVVRTGVPMLPKYVRVIERMLDTSQAAPPAANLTREAISAFAKVCRASPDRIVWRDVVYVLPGRPVSRAMKFISMFGFQRRPHQPPFLADPGTIWFGVRRPSDDTPMLPQYAALIADILAEGVPVRMAARSPGAASQPEMYWFNELRPPVSRRGLTVAMVHAIRTCELQGTCITRAGFESAAVELGLPLARVGAFATALGFSTDPHQPAIDDWFDLDGDMSDAPPIKPHLAAILMDMCGEGVPAPCVCDNLAPLPNPSGSVAERANYIEDVLRQVTVGTISGPQVAAIAERVGVGRYVATHYLPRLGFVGPGSGSVIDGRFVHVEERWFGPDAIVMSDDPFPIPLVRRGSRMVKEFRTALEDMIKSSDLAAARSATPRRPLPHDGEPQAATHHSRSDSTAATTDTCLALGLTQRTSNAARACAKRRRQVFSEAGKM